MNILEPLDRIYGLQRCIDRFPFYREWLKGTLGSLPGATDDCLPADLPVWTKQHQREFFKTLRPEDFAGCILHSTGGSTGVPTQFYMTRESSEWRQSVTDRGYGYVGGEPGRRALYIWGDPARPVPLPRRVKTRIHNRILNRTYFNCFHFDDERKRLCCDIVNSLRPETIVGYSSKLAELARFVRDSPSILEWRAKNIITAAEGLQPGQRELIEEYLGGNVYMSYGSREFMLIGIESRYQDGYHLSDDNLLVEVVDDDGHPLPPGETGRICVTDLHNSANPFIRYEIGDSGTMAEEESPPPGFPFRRLRDVLGRNGEFVYKLDGSKLTALFFPHSFKEFPWIDSYQLVQKSKGHLLVRLVTEPPLSDIMENEIKAQLQPKLGGMRLDIERVDELEKKENGKTPTVILDLSEDRDV